jgi:hypothetical protein
MPPDLLCGLNLAKAHLHLANEVLQLVGKMTPARRSELCRGGTCTPNGSIDERLRYLVAEIQCMSGAEVIRELYPDPSAAHREAYTAALRIAEQARLGLPFSVTVRELRRLRVAVEDEAWAATRPESAIGSEVSDRPIILALGQEQYCLKGGNVIVVSNAEDDVLRAFLDAPGERGWPAAERLSTKKIEERSERIGYVHTIMTKLKKGPLGSAIDLPGRERRGRGYGVRIRRLT